jgi:hypothetical protein
MSPEAGGRGATMGYPSQDFEPETRDDPLKEAVAGLRLESRPYGSPDRPTILLTAAGEPPWAPGSAMVLLSARLLRMLLMHARFLRPRRRGRRHRHRIDMRV